MKIFRALLKLIKDRFAAAAARIAENRERAWLDEMDL